MLTSYEVVWGQIKASMPAGMTAQQAVLALPGIPSGTVKSALVALKKSENIYAKPVKEGCGVFMATLRYFTNKDAYEKIKYVPNSVGKKPRQKAMGFSVPEVQPVAQSPQVQVVKFVDIDHLTLAEARSLHRRLSKMFAN